MSFNFKDFEALGHTWRDNDTLDEEEAPLAINTWNILIQRQMDATGRADLTMCDSFVENNEFEDAWRLEKATNPRADYDMFRADWNADHDKGNAGRVPGSLIKTITAYDRNGPVGSMLMYNMVITDTIGGREAAAYPAPSFTTDRLVADAMGYFLKNTLQTDDDLNFDILEWVFPTDVRNQRWSGEQEALHLSEVLDQTVVRRPTAEDGAVVRLTRRIVT